MKNVGKFLNYRVVDITGRGKVGDLFGVELELEGRGVMMEGVGIRGWKRTHDNSLRGESVEFVFADPCKIEVAKERVTSLFKKMKAEGVDLKNSYRTSTHVHLNFGDKTVKQMLTFFTLFTMLEEILENYSGDDRVGNLFCLSSRRSEGIIRVLSDSVLKHQNLGDFNADRYKYAACNLSTLYKFGTLEIRTMRGAHTAEQVNDWLDILNELLQRSLKAKDPREFIENISMLGPDGFLRDVFSARCRMELVKGLPAGFDFRNSLLEGARLCQMFAYEIGDDFNEVAVVKEVNGPARAARPGPLNIADGRHGYIIYHPGRRGARWHVSPVRGEIFFHGDCVVDDQELRFDEDSGRFVYRDRFCAWQMHPAFGDEVAHLNGAPFYDIDAGRPVPQFGVDIPDFEDHDDEDEF